MLVLTWAAAASERIGLGTRVLMLPQRHPVALAKELASLDVLSRGRLTPGVGIGYLDEELAALRVARGRRAEQHLAAMRAPWKMPAPSFSGNWLRFNGVGAYPRPVQAGGPPVVMGGHSPGAWRRAVRHAQGWYRFLLDSAAAGATVDAIAEIADAEIGSGYDSFQISVTPRRWPDPADVAAFRDAGVDRLICWPQQASAAAWHDANDNLASLAAATAGEEAAGSGTADGTGTASGAGKVGAAHGDTGAAGGADGPGRAGAAVAGVDAPAAAGRLAR